MAGPAILLEIITYIFQCTPPTCECDEPLIESVFEGFLSYFWMHVQSTKLAILILAY